MVGLRRGFFAVVLSCFVPSSAFATESPAAALARAAAAYRAAPSLAERLDYTVSLPDGREERKAIEYGWAQGRRFLAMLAPDGSRIFHVTAGDGALRAVQFNVGAAFLEAPFDDSLTDALRAVGAAQIGLAVPSAVAALEGGEEGFVESFGFGLLTQLRPAAIDSAAGLTRVTLEADGGNALARLEVETGRLVGISLEVGSAGSTVSLDGSIVAIEAPPSDPRWRIDTAGRQPVDSFTELEASAFPLGQPAPDLEARSLTGDTVSLASLRGRVVILEFWATWCVPCWSGLEKVERLARWVSQSGLPIAVWTVDTLEQTSTFADQAAQASGFLTSRGLEIPVLIDFDDAFFGGMHSPGLPSTVVIAPDGTLAHYHSGVSESMEEDLRAQAMALLTDDPG